MWGLRPGPKRQDTVAIELHAEEEADSKLGPNYELAPYAQYCTLIYC